MALLGDQGLDIKEGEKQNWDDPGKGKKLIGRRNVGGGDVMTKAEDRGDKKG